MGHTVLINDDELNNNSVNLSFLIHLEQSSPYRMVNFILFVRKDVFTTSDPVVHKLAFAATDTDNQRLKNFDK